MKKESIRLALLVQMAGLMLSSCIREEALNAEADITDVSVEGVTLIRKPVVTNSEVLFYVNGWQELDRLSPKFKTTDGATIEPASGTERDFTRPQSYTVTSQDGRWKKTYKVSFVSDDVATEYHFDNMKWYEYRDTWNPAAPVQKLFHILVDKTSDGHEFEWGSGNSGFLFAANGATADRYPTCQEEEGYKGKCAKLQTVSTAAFALLGTPIAAGNLFTGTFELNFSNPAKSTRFGVPFRKKPKELVGYYKYKAGPTFTDKHLNKIADRKDSLAVYAVLFETGDGVDYLDGTNSLTSDRIVLLAQLKEGRETDEWTRFSIPFKAVGGRSVDPEKLRQGKYSLAIIMSSSKDGAAFNGAVGSTLYVDELKLFSE